MGYRLPPTSIETRFPGAAARRFLLKVTSTKYGSMTLAELIFSLVSTRLTANSSPVVQ